MAGHASLAEVTLSRWITKICGHSNLIYSEFHHISSLLFIYKEAADTASFITTQSQAHHSV